MMQAQLSVQQWLQIPHLVRLRIAAIFSLTKSEGTFLEGGVLRSDGYTWKDLQGITITGLQQYLHDFNDHDYYSLIEKLIKKVDSEQSNEQEAYDRLDRDKLTISWTNQLNTIREEAESKHLLTVLLDILNNLFAFEAIKPSKTAVITNETIKETKKLGRPKGGKKTA